MPVGSNAMAEVAPEAKPAPGSVGLAVAGEGRGASKTPAIVTTPYLFGGFTVLALVLLGLFVWAQYTSISGAVLAHATVVVDSNVKKVQHPTGGIVGKILVRNGDLVEAGQLLIRLDDTQTRANLQIIANQIDETEARLARLFAERDLADEITNPQILLERKGDPRVSRILAGERMLFERRRASLHGETEQMRERIRQLEQEIAGLTAQQSAKATETKLIGEELHSLEGLEPEPQPGGHGRPDRLYDREGGPRSGAEWPPEPGVGRVVNGMAARVDRLKAIGNGQVPRVAATAWALMSPVEVVQILSSDPLDASK